MKAMMIAGWLAGVAGFSGSAGALTLLPGQSGTAQGTGIGAAGAVVASIDAPFYEQRSDAVSTDNFHTSGTQTPAGGRCAD